MTNKLLLKDDADSILQHDGSVAHFPRSRDTQRRLHAVLPGEAGLDPVVAAGETAMSFLHGPDRPDLIRTECLAEIFESTARRIPEKAALESGDRILSYGQLNALADNVAGWLLSHDIGPGDIVGLWLPRGCELLIMQLGIAKAGAAWLPFDTEAPLERIRACLDDANAKGLLASEADLKCLSTLNCPVWLAGSLVAIPTDKEFVRPEVLPEHPAYVIYTSGSTGKPKGIGINQGAICHFLRSENALLGIREDDRVYQGFSVAFDMSFEEIWISYLVGATLWLAPREIAADPENLPIALGEQRITVLHAVPTLLALFSRDVPSLRVINLGGEACPENLVGHWARSGRQLFNTYGPTEATVSASIAELRPGQPVTIGRPLPNYSLLVIDPAVENGLQCLPEREVGELCITGPGVSFGYLGRPELTAEKFLPNPWARGSQDARLYRTGDLACIDETGQIRCLGRTDDQVKIRGFRVELGEIEAVLVRQPGVGTAAVLLRTDEGVERLAAYMVADSNAVAFISTVRASLAAILPPYMVPGHYEILSVMPRLASGKIDRKTLRTRPLQAPAAEAGLDAVAESAHEQALFPELARLFPGQPIRRDADFFNDLGGHSLLAARLASALRNHEDYRNFSVREIYGRRTVEGIVSALAELARQPRQTLPDWQAPSAWRRWRCGMAQAAAIPCLSALSIAQLLAPFFTYHYFTGDPGDSIVFAIAASIGVFLLAIILQFVVAIAGKWLILGRLQPGTYPLWGLTYYRWWLSGCFVAAAPAYLLSGSPLYVGLLRALGARIGRDVTIGSATLRAPDNLVLGDGVSIGNAVNLENARVEHGILRVGEIVIERNAHVGSYCVLEGDIRIGEEAQLDGQSALAEGARIPDRQFWRGSPAQQVAGATPQVLPSRVEISPLQRLWEGWAFLCGAAIVSVIFFTPLFPTFILVDLLDVATPFWQSGGIHTEFFKYFVLALPVTPFMIGSTILLSIALRWSFLPRLRAGRWPVHSAIYYCRWLVNLIQESSLSVLHGLYATVYAPLWYRLLGARVGRNAEISTAQGLVPDMLTLGDETFIADAVILGDEEVRGGWMSLQPTTISRRSFVGNGAYVPDGTVLPENVLLGVHSRAPENNCMRPGDTWLGSPPINLPAREQTVGFPDTLTFRPSRWRWLGRALVEALRIMIPHAIVVAVGYTIVLEVMPFAEAGRWNIVVWSLILSALLFNVGSFLFVVALKWLLIGRYRQKAAPMWTPFVWISEAVTNLYEGLAVPNFMSYLQGTPWLPVAFSLLGCRMGRGVYLNTTDITEFDCVHIGDHSELNALSCPQTHLFEDRVMKIDHVHIGERVTLGPRSAVLYGAFVGDNASLGPLTLCMKGERIPAATRWHGCPAVPVHEFAATT